MPHRVQYTKSITQLDVMYDRRIHRDGLSYEAERDLLAIAKFLVLDQPC